LKKGIRDWGLVYYKLNPDIFWQKIYFDRITVGMSNPMPVHVRHLQKEMTP